ncbi:MAG: OmpA family protein [Alphaproteobacteria bacterium]|nr:OmpA family protein [Alphaproteobacteria bacterium]
MKLNIKSAMFALVPLALAACAGTELGETRGMQVSGSAFDKALFEGYIDRSQFEYGIGNYSSSDAFALKARAAANGETVLPWTPNDPNSHPPGTVPEDELASMLDGREKLLAAFADGARDRFPADAASAQVHYDCWIEEQSYMGDFAESNQPEEAAKCRDGFWDALAKLTPAPPPPPSNFLVFFNWDSSSITEAARQVIAQAAEAIRNNRITRILAVGHADKSGPASYNVGLSERRAEAVEGALAAQGVPAGNVDVEWRGEADPLVATPDGVREPQNRRVEIILQP